MASPEEDQSGAIPGTAWAPSPQLWRDRPVVLTGATGFLGSHLTAALVDLGAAVAVLSRDQVPLSPVASPWRERVSWVMGDVSDQAAVERLLGEYEAATVFHLAAQSQVQVANRNPVATWEANVAGTWSVLEAARRSPGVDQVVVASSDKAYGNQPALPYDEAMPLRAVNPYDVSKACADLIARCYHHSFGVPVAITRCGNFFGPGDANWGRLVPGTIRSVLRGERPVIRSDGTMVRDYLYVGDGALAYLRLAEAMAADPSLAGEAFNFSNEEPLTVLQLVAMIQQAAGTDLAPDVLDRARGEIDRQVLSATKARQRLGWAPAWPMDEAVKVTVEWYRSYLDRRVPARAR